MKGSLIALRRLEVVVTADRAARNAIGLIANYIERTSASARFGTKNNDNAFLEGMQQIFCSLRCRVNTKRQTPQKTQPRRSRPSRRVSQRVSGKTFARAESDSEKVARITCASTAR